MLRIDLIDVLQRSVSSFYGDLVTRPTGRAVRSGIERLLEHDRGDVAAIDFGLVRCLDYSCADEIVGRLLLDHGRARYFLLCGVSEAQREAIEPILEHHGLAVVAADRSGRLQLLGRLPDQARQAFGVLAESGAAAPDEVAARLEVPPAEARDALNELLARRLVVATGAGYRALTLA